MTIWDEIKTSFKTGNALTKLIYINLGVFLAIRLLFVIYYLIDPDGIGAQFRADVFQNKYVTYLMVPADIMLLIVRPWTILSYMFLHFDFLHIIFNMLILFWFGRIYLKYFSEKQLLSTYLLGGFSGAALFIVFSNVFPGLSPENPMLGASAAVMATVIAIAYYAPNYEVNFMFIGSVKIKYIALVYVVLDVVQIASINSGGHIAHLGGALFGFLFAHYFKQGKDIGAGFNRFADQVAVLFKRQPNMKVSYKSNATRMTDHDYNKHKAEMQNEMDRILEKIAKSGYDSLSKKEKEVLFKMSNKS